MRRITYVLQFRGRAAPSTGSPTVLQSEASAESTIFTTTVDDGVQSSTQTAPGGEAVVRTQVTILSENAFEEHGEITFGSEHVLRFRTIGQGYIERSGDPRYQSGSVIWRVDSGQGQFADAQGLITSNFTLSKEGELIDNQVGILFVE